MWCIKEGQQSKEKNICGKEQERFMELRSKTIVRKDSVREGMKEQGQFLEKRV